VVFSSLLDEQRMARLQFAADETRRLLQGRVVWNVNSTASGGGVAEMLRVLVGYIRGAGIDSRWLVMRGDSEFYTITKRIHNRIHGWPGDTGSLGSAETAHYEAVASANASALSEQVSAGDVVLLHDPQTAGMISAMRHLGARVIWRSHIGTGKQNSWSEEGWRFLRPYLDDCDAFVFSRMPYVPDWIPRDRVAIIPPSIDPFSPKNQPIPDEDLPRYLAQIGLIAGPSGNVTFTRADGTAGTLGRQAVIVAEGAPPERLLPLVVQVSRWDRLKDMPGVLTGFASRVWGRVDAELALVGPQVDGVNDDPEGAAVLGQCIEAWDALPLACRRRVRLVTLPMADIEENAVMVNAIQRSAAVIVQKSLMEGFGLTVAEAMWKAKPVVASAVGGILDQITRDTGVLLSDPEDLDAFGDTVASLLEHRDRMDRLGANARRQVLEDFVGDQHLLRYANLIQQLVHP
jgi:trehalose synthase